MQDQEPYHRALHHVHTAAAFSATQQLCLAPAGGASLCMSSPTSSTTALAV